MSLNLASEAGHVEVLVELLAHGFRPDADEAAALKRTKDLDCAYLLLVSEPHTWHAPDRALTVI